MKEYKKRIADKLLEYRLEEVGAVLIEGPKWCGKTTTAEQQAIEKGVATLTTLASKIDTAKMKTPAFMMVLTAVGDYAYQRKDGVYVVPVGCLKD